MIIGMWVLREWETRCFAFLPGFMVLRKQIDGHHDSLRSALSWEEG